MKILVCIKQVPVSASQMTAESSGTWFSPVPGIEWKMNRFDACALEAAVQLKEKRTDASVDVISLGPDRVKEVIRRAMGMGADNGIHIDVAEDGYLSPARVAGAIQAAIKEASYDLILTGIMGEDLMQAQTGPMLAALLEIPCVTGVIEFSEDDESGTFSIIKELETGTRQPIRAQTPMVLTIQAGNYQPRYPNVSKLLRANRAEIPTVSMEAADDGSRETVLGVAIPESRRSCRILDGSAEEKADALIALFRRQNLIA